MIIEAMNTELFTLADRARIHAALGDPARLAIVDTLVAGDAAPGELGAALELPTNLVAHHLKVFEDAAAKQRSLGRQPIVLPDTCTSERPSQRPV
jgi:hypothetical protein